MRKKHVWIVLDDCGGIVDIFDSEQKANELYEQLTSVSPRESFYYTVEKKEVH